MPSPTFEILRLSTVESTSTYAAQLVAAGRAPPFMVWALQQSGGRGRRGHAWVSPPGNLYVTLALPPEPGPLAAHGGLSLKAGVVTARILERLLGLRLTLKWPNDLLFGGRKLGGLLLEGSVVGGRAGCVLVGLGLNVASAPSLADAPYESICLADILGYPPVLEAFVPAFAQAWEREWPDLPLDDVGEAYRRYATGEGALWQGPAAEGGWRREGRVRADGMLELQALQTGEPLVLSSVDHGWRWLHQGTAAHPLVVADVGNTKIKLAWFADARDAEPSEVAAWALDDLAGGLPPVLERVGASLPVRPWPLHMLSVNPQGAAHLRDLAQAAGFAVAAIPKRPVRRHGDGYDVSALGADRLAALEGYLAGLARSLRGDPAHLGVVVSAGTATTIDVVRADGRHLGGLIIPGLQTGLAALHRSASLLPPLILREETLPLALPTLGHETRTAMLGGVLAMTLGVVWSARQAALKETGATDDTIEVVLTGGDAATLARYLDARVDPALVLKGARVMVRGGD